MEKQKITLIDLWPLSIFTIAYAWCYVPCTHTVNKYAKNYIHRAGAPQICIKYQIPYLLFTRITPYHLM